MATITLKNVPDQLYSNLKVRATSNRRSINSEAIRCLESVLENRRLGPEEVLERAREIRRQNPNLFITDEIVNRAKRQGRP